MVFQLQGQNTRRSLARGPRILMRQSQPRCHPVFGEREEAVALHVRTSRAQTARRDVSHGGFPDFQHASTLT